MNDSTLKNKASLPEKKIIGVFVRDKIAAKIFLENLSKRGYQFSPSRFHAENAGNTVIVFPMDSIFADDDPDKSRIAMYRFDEILIPSNISLKYEKLARDRLKPITGIAKIYRS